MASPFLSLCMIVKNEAEDLPRCLKSVEGIVDEIIVVDTGSEDETIAVAQSYGAKVYTYPWQGDFSAARNFSLEKAQGEWILVLDADEELVKESAQDLHNFLLAAQHTAYFLQEINYVGEKPGAEAVLHLTPRLFQNRPEYRYKGAIHEQIGPSIIENGGSIGFSPVKLLHYGYLRKAVLDKNKIQRNITILENEVKRQPFDPFTRYNLGIEYMRLEQYEEALKHFKVAFSKLPSLEMGYASILVRNIAWALRQLKRYKDALKVVDDAILAYPDYTDLVFLKAQVLADMKRFSQAASFFELCIKQGEASPRHITEQGVGSYKAWYALGQIYEQLGDLGQAVRAYTQALDANPRFLPPIDNLADILIPRENVEEVRAFFARHVNMEDEDTLATLAVAFAKKGKYEVSVDYINTALTRFPQSQQFLLLKGQALLYLKQYEEALKFFTQVKEYSHFYPQALMNKAFTCFLIDNYPAAWEAVEHLHQLGANIPELPAFSALLGLVSENNTSPQSSLTWNEQNEKGVLALLDALIKLEEYTKFEKALPLMEIFPPERQKQELGRLYFQHGFLDLAAEELLEVAKTGQVDGEVFSMLGDICMEKGLYEDAEVFYRHALLKEKKVLRYYTALVNSLAKQQKFSEAALVLQEAIRYFPESEMLRATLTTLRSISKSIK